ncbi:ShlB/FhaC/HecB family hemolysin secretion/activation protein [Frigidibacter sp. ROC022]|uniref:ShlB/FhaC/HecB family hemolysin secretion/activation protein n=1 Tax=Frigidibacter sp. ROC022 TaxID=2971796 RepID=UPI00215A4E9F|nr:ShlB/FhaC/HecB family hemolysin secretion/activation protein [Frigidibacter sp. ROC022]MCR8725715.1 ShlB/FhaC/HecB family hemolysin secretion/activation protein [Frigidibacter sp. ROC022]
MTISSCGSRSIPASSGRGRSSLGLVLALLALAAAGPIRAQTAAEIADPSYEPPAQRLTGALVFSGEPGLKAPPGADKLSILITDVTVSNALPGTEEQVQALIDRLTGHRIAVSEIFAAAAELEAAYARAGFVLSRVVIPAQTLVDGGKLRLTIIDGYVETIDDSAVPPSLRGRISGLTRPLVGKRGLRLADLERRLLLAGDTYGVALGSALAAGATPGGTVIVLDPVYRRLTGFFGIDNSFSDALGNYNISSGLELNGALGLGEVIYGRLSGHPQLGGEGGLFSANPRLRTLALGTVVPVGEDGLTFGLEATQSRTTPESAGGASTSSYERLSARIFYPLIRSTRKNLSVQLSFDMARDRLDLLTAVGKLPLHEDRTRVLRLSADGVWIRDKGAVFEAGAVLSLGFDALGARSREDASGGTPLSRDGADAAFKKLELSARYRQPFADVYSLSIAGQAQTAFGAPLLSSEQFGIASLQGLSPFDEGALSGDAGWLIRAEVSRRVESQAFGKPLLINPYLFGAVGEVYRARPSAGEAGRVGAVAYGLGVELVSIRDPKFSSGTLRIEYGEGNRDDGGQDARRLTIQGSYRF